MTAVPAVTGCRLPSLQLLALQDAAAGRVVGTILEQPTLRAAFETAGVETWPGMPVPEMIAQARRLLGLDGGNGDGGAADRPHEAEAAPASDLAEDDGSLEGGPELGIIAPTLELARDAAGHLASLLSGEAAPGPDRSGTTPGPSDEAGIDSEGCIAPQTLPDGRATFLGARTGRIEVAILAALVAGPVAGRELAARLGRRWSTVSLALRALEAEGRVVRSQRTGRGTRWALVGTP